MLAATSFLELLGVVFIVAVPTVPVTYFLWTTLASSRSRRAREVTTGSSSATPFGLLSIVGTVCMVAAIVVTLLVIGVRAWAT